MPVPLPLSLVGEPAIGPGTPVFPTTRVKYYLIDATHSFPTSGYFTHMTRLESPVQYGSKKYFLVAAIVSDAQDLALRVIEPQPSGWTGTVGQAKAVLRASSLIHFWWLFDSFAARYPRPSEVLTKFVALVGGADGYAFPDEWGFHPVLWEQGYEAWFNMIQFDEILALSPRVMYNRPFGSDVDMYVVGYYPSGDPISCEPLGPRILETKTNLPSHILGGFEDSFGPRCSNKASDGGEVIAYMGAPSLTFLGTGVDWVRESRNCNMNPAFDVAGAVSRWKANQTVRVTDELLALGDRIYIEPHDTINEEYAGWYDGRFRVMSTEDRAENVYNQAGPGAPWSLPSPPSENMVWIFDNDPEVRYNRCKLWIDRGWSVATAIRINTTSPLGQDENMSEAQVNELVEYGL